MKRVFAVAACWAGLASMAHAADVGVSIQFSQPGVFGRVDIGQFPEPPQVIVPQAVIIAPPPAALPPPEPVYLWVPLEHRKHWERYCGQYHACGHPVYFVNHVWYRDHVMAQRGRGGEMREHEGRGEHGRSDEEHGRHRGHDDEDRGRGGDEHGHGHGR
jgi:hypothetical protein